MNKHLPQKLLLSTIICCLLSGITLVTNAQAKTWKGITNDWNNSNNWNPLGVPGSGNNVTIPAVGGTVAFAPILSANGSCGTITFSGSTTISSATALLILTAGNTITTNSAISATISCNLALGASTTFNFGNASSNLLVSGVVSGSGAIIKSGTGVLTLSALNTFTGTTTVNNGTLKIGASSSGAFSPLGDQSSGTSVTGTGILDLNGFSISNTEALSLSGSGTGGIGALTNSAGVQAFYTAPVILTASAGIGVANAPINLNNITGANTVTKIGVGDLIFGSGISTLNSLTINGGSVKVNNNLSLTAASSSLTVNSGTLDMGAFVLTVSTSYVGGSATGQIKTANTGATPISTNIVWTPIVNFASATGGQTLVPGTYLGGLSLSGSSGTQTASGNIVGVSGIDIAGNTILNMAGFLLTGSTITTSTGAIVDMGAGDIQFSDFTGLLGLVRFSGATNGKPMPAGTVEYNGASQSVTAGDYFNLTINESTGNATTDPYNPTTVNGILTLTAGNLDITADFSVNGGIVRTAGFLVGNQYSNLNLGGSTGNAEPLYFAPGSAIGFLTLSHSVSATTTLNADLSIYGGINFGSTDDVLDFNGQHITLVSDGNGTAYIGQAFTPVSGATNVTAERYVGLGSRAWRLLTFPLTGVGTIRDAWAGGAAPNPNAALGGETAGNGTLITGNGFTSGAPANLLGFDWFTGLGSGSTSSIRSYTSANGWASVNTPNPIAAPLEQGYMLYVRGDRTVADISSSGVTTLKPTGTLRQGAQTVTIPANPFVLVGNPYPAFIDLSAVQAANSSVITKNFWVWDPSFGTSGAYRTISDDGLGGFTDAAYLAVNSSQSFFVQPNGLGGTLTIDESQKTTTVPQVLFRPMGSAESVVSNLKVSLYHVSGATPGAKADVATARFNNIYNVSATEVYDAAKLNNFNENIGLVRDGRYLSIESRPVPTQSDTLFVPAWNLKVQDYALIVSSNYFTGINATAVLMDKFTNTQKVIDLNNAATTYNFSVTSDPASTSLNRFLIVLNPSSPLAVGFTKLTAVQLGNSVQVNWTTASEQGVKIYEVEKSSDGIVFAKSATVDAKNAATGASYQWIDESPVKGNNFYRIRSVDESGKISYSSIAVVNVDGKQGIQVYPTLITDHHFTLSLQGQVAGNYVLMLTSSNGQRVYQNTVKFAGGNSTVNVDLNNTILAAGIYNLSVAAGDGTIQNFKLVVNN